MKMNQLKVKEEKSPILMQAESFLKEFDKTSLKLIETIDNLLMFNDLDEISNVIDKYESDVNNIKKEIQYYKDNPTDIFYGLKYTLKTPKFRRYANNKRTFEKLGQAEVW